MRKIYQGAVVLALTLASTLTGCGMSLPGSIDKNTPSDPIAPSAPDAGTDAGIPRGGLPVDVGVKLVDLVAVENAIYGSGEYRTAASKVFNSVLRPYYLARGFKAQQAAILKRIAFNCTENIEDPTQLGHSLAFPVDLSPAHPGAVIWHRYDCTYTLSNGYTSPHYAINQIDVQYGQARVEPGTAFQNLEVPGDGRSATPWLGRFVQPLNLMLRDNKDQPPANVLAGINGGYDYRVDAWDNTHLDNICPAREGSLGGDRRHFYTHPVADQCPMGDNTMPGCANLNDANSLPVPDDLGDSLVYLAPQQRAKSWRSTPLQSQNCGGISQAYYRGAILFYPDHVGARRTSPSLDNVAELSDGNTPAVSALGSGPLAIQDDHFVYDQNISEEGLDIDNYEVASGVGAGYEKNADGSTTVHIVHVEGEDNSFGMHDWQIALYFLSPYAHSNGANILGNGGDATIWVNPQSPAVQAVLADEKSPNHAAFERWFVKSGHPGLVANCDGFDRDTIDCSARPVHDGLFVYSQ